MLQLILKVIIIAVCLREVVVVVEKKQHFKKLQL